MASITTKKRKNGIKWYVIQNHYNADGERRPIWVPCTDRKEALRLLPGAAEGGKLPALRV